VGYRQDLAACALWDSVVVLPEYFLGHCAPGIRKGHKVALSSIDGEQIRDHLTSYGQRRSIGIPFLQFRLIDPRQLVVAPGRQLGGLHQHLLDMLVALFGQPGADQPCPQSSFHPRRAHSS